MTGPDKHHSRTSYAGRDPELRRGTPASLRLPEALRQPFDHARDPLISKQLNDQAKSEAQRREESGRGSEMVRLHRPFPELKPAHEQAPIRAAFNRAWLREQRLACMADSQWEALQDRDQPMNTMEYPVR